MSRPRPPMWGLLLLLASMCAPQLLRLTEHGMPVADAITAIVVVVALVTGLPLLAFVLLGSPNRKLLAKLNIAEREGESVFAIFLSRELRDALRPISSLDGEAFRRHGVMHVSAAGIDVWSTPKRGPATPELVASILRSDVIWASEETIPIEGGGFWGLRLEVWPSDDGETVTLPIGLANRRIAAFFPSRREVARAHARIHALVTSGDRIPPA